MGQGDEEDLLRSVALQNARSILLARQRAEQELIEAQEALELKTHELAHSLALVRATLECATDGIVMVDESGKVTGFNENFLKMWGIPPEVMGAVDHRQLLEMSGHRFRDPGQFLARIEDISASSLPEAFDLLELADGSVFERYSRSQLVNERNVGRVWSFRDVTERKRAEEERKQLLEREQFARAEAERASRMKDDFLANLSHELRTPLNAIVGWTQVLRRRAMDDAEIRQGLETIERNARVQAQLIEDLLDMSRITSGKVRLDVQLVDPVSFIEAAVDAVRPAADARGIRLEKILDPAAGPISGDPRRLQQVIWNLLSNAIKFTPKDGTVQVLLERVDAQVEISVADTGIGITPAFVAHAFERFRQADASSARRHGGLGLGLAIVKQLVELHGGTVRVKSLGEGAGTVFTVQLPITAVHRSTDSGERLHPHPAKTLSSDFKISDLAGIKVLVVDDEADARDLFKRVLADCGAEVLTVASAGEALVVVETERPHVLLSDIGMPDIDGFELLRRVRALGPARGGTLPAIALTAFARSEDRTRALRAGFLVHVAKPVEPAELVATVAAVAGRTGEPEKE
jgi:PAS domain S-box-containing protein